MILVDSSVWIDYFRGRATDKCNLLHRLLGAERLLTGDPILARVSAPRLTSGAPCTCWGRWSFYRSPAVKSLSARRDYRTLRNEGITVPKTIDGLIATFCIANHHTLLHSDRDYDGFERYLGLRVISNGTPAP